MTWQYTAEVVRVIDGDTVVLTVCKELDFGFYVKQRQTYTSSFRLMGIDAPESRGVNADIEAAAKTTARLKELLSSGPIRAVTYKSDSFGRWLVDLYVTQSDGTELFVNQALVDEGLAIPYVR